MIAAGIHRETTGTTTSIWPDLTGPRQSNVPNREPVASDDRDKPNRTIRIPRRTIHSPNEGLHHPVRRGPARRPTTAMGRREIPTLTRSNGHPDRGARIGRILTVPGTSIEALSIKPIHTISRGDAPRPQVPVSGVSSTRDKRHTTIRTLRILMANLNSQKQPTVTLAIPLPK